MLYQPYKYKAKLAITPIHNHIESNTIKVNFKEYDRNREKELHKAVLEFKRSLIELFPLVEAAKVPIKEVSKIAKRYPEKYERRAIKKHFLRARYATAGGKNKAVYSDRTTTKRKKKYTYTEYINSSEWRERRNSYFQRYGRKCAACLSVEKIHLHHMVYSAYNGKEPDSHLMPLCESHHNAYHQKYGTSRSMLKTTKNFIDEVRAYGKSL